MTPPPMTTMDLGNLGRLSASVLVMTRFLSTSRKGKVLGLADGSTESDKAERVLVNFEGTCREL